LGTPKSKKFWTPHPHLPHPPHAQMKIIKPVSCILPHFCWLHGICIFNSVWSHFLLQLISSEQIVGTWVPTMRSGSSLELFRSYLSITENRKLRMWMNKSKTRTTSGFFKCCKNIHPDFTSNPLGCGGETLADPLPNELDLGVPTACQVRSAFYCASMTTHMHKKLPRIHFFPHDTRWWVSARDLPGITSQNEKMKFLWILHCVMPWLLPKSSQPWLHLTWALIPVMCMASSITLHVKHATIWSVPILHVPLKKEEGNYAYL